MSKIATSIEQSERLLEAGIDPQTADMFYINGANLIFSYWGEDRHDYDDVPAWSLSALITLCPEHVPYRIIRTRGKDIEGIFEDLVEFLCKEK